MKFKKTIKQEPIIEQEDETESEESNHEVSFHSTHDEEQEEETKQEESDNLVKRFFDSKPLSIEIKPTKIDLK